MELVVPMFTTMSHETRRIRELLSTVTRVLLIEGNTMRKLGYTVPSSIGGTYQAVLAHEDVNKRLAEFQDSVPDDLALEFLAKGSPSEVIERIERFRKAGATHIIVQFLDRMEEEMRLFAEKVLPLLRD